MRPVDSPSFWSSFPQDPRDPAHAGLRASDRDREAVFGVLAAAYADGRLDHAEHDERCASVSGARTLGELPALVADLVPASPVRRDPGGPALASPDELARRAELAWRKDVRGAFGTVLLPGLVCVAIWLLTIAPDGHFWPAWVLLGTGINLLQTLLRRDDIIERHRRSLDQRQARELRRRERDA